MVQQRSASSPDYDTDFFAWTQHQAAPLRALNRLRPELPVGLDIEHVAEEIEDLGKAELRGVTSLIRQLLVHLLKAASETDSQARAHWRAEATAFQADLPDRYAPPMRQLIDMDALWRKALKIADAGLQEHGSSLASDIPDQCPYTVGEMLGEDFSFDGALERLREAQKVS
jgi:hypothetical protein